MTDEMAAYLMDAIAIPNGVEGDKEDAMLCEAATLAAQALRAKVQMQTEIDRLQTARDLAEQRLVDFRRIAGVLNHD